MRSLVRQTSSELQDMNDMWDRLMAWTFDRPHGLAFQQGSSSLPIEIYEKDNSLFIRAAVPGMRPEDLDISIESDVLTLRGEFRQKEETQEAKVYRQEFRYGSFNRSIRLPQNLQLENIEAEFDNGIVMIRIPKQQTEEKKALKVPVKAKNQASAK